MGVLTQPVRSFPFPFSIPWSQAEVPVLRNLHAYLVHHTSSAAVSVPCFSPFFLSRFLPADLVYLSNRRLSTDFFPSPSYFLLPIVPFILLFFPPSHPFIPSHSIPLCLTRFSKPWLETGNRIKLVRWKIFESG